LEATLAAKEEDASFPYKNNRVHFGPGGSAGKRKVLETKFWPNLRFFLCLKPRPLIANLCPTLFL